MLLAILILLQVVQANEFVRFELCYLDRSAHPGEFRPHPQGHWAQIRINAVEGYTDAKLGLPPETGGIGCTRIFTTGGTFFVIGTQDEIRAKLREAENAGEESRQ